MNNYHHIMVSSTVISRDEHHGPCSQISQWDAMHHIQVIVVIRANNLIIWCAR